MSYNLTIKFLEGEASTGSKYSSEMITPGGPGSEYVTPGGYGSEGQDGNQAQLPPNLYIHAKNQENLNEFETKLWFNPDYYMKLQKWVNKSQYTCEDISKTKIKVTVEIFTFILEKSKKSDTELIRTELSEAKHESDQLLKDLKLFNYYFLNNWNDKYRDTIKSKDFICQPCIEAPQNLYNITDGIGFVEEDEEYGEKSYYLGFKQPLSLIQINKKDKKSALLTGSAELAKKQTIFINGKGIDYQVADVDSVYSHKMMIEGYSAPMYMHKISTPVIIDEKYEILTPKIFV